MEWSSDLNEIAAAYAAYQAEITDPIRDKTVIYQGKTQYKHVELCQILEIARPILSRNGLSFIQSVGSLLPTEDESSKNIVIIINNAIIHKSGQWLKERSELLVPFGPNKMMNDLQAVGSAITYFRRYTAAPILCMAQADDDGQSWKEVKLSSNREVNPCDTSKIDALIKEYNIPSDVVSGWLAYYKVGRLNALSQTQMDNLAKKTYEKYEGMGG